MSFSIISTLLPTLALKIELMSMLTLAELLFHPRSVISWMYYYNTLSWHKYIMVNSLTITFSLFTLKIINPYAEVRTPIIIFILLINKLKLTD